MIEYWNVEDTGWSNGVSWFSTGGTSTNPLRFNSNTAAVEYATKRKAEFNQPTTKWRVVHTTVERTENREVITREWSII